MEESDARDMIFFFLDKIHKETRLTYKSEWDDFYPIHNWNNRDSMLSHFINDTQKKK